jgi:SDR family mycofactocin-dependent oxidoreductase
MTESSGRFAGRVALVTGAARGQGRSHALRFAAEGADVVALDIASDIGSVKYPLATPEDLETTAREVRALGREAIARVVDVRSQEQLDSAVADAVDELGRLDIVSANAGILDKGAGHLLSEQAFCDVIDVNLTGVWRTIKAVAPAMIAGGRGGAIVLTSSTAGLRSTRNLAHYIAAKHGVVGLTKAFAVELGEYSIRVNAVAPTTVNTPMVMHQELFAIFRPDLENPTADDVAPVFEGLNLLPVPWLEPGDVSDAVAWLASDEARFITGSVLPVDAGAASK